MSTNIRVTKTFSFDMAHALYGHDGPCRNIHGHTYQLSVTLLGKPKSTIHDPKLGMVIDFGDLKRIVNTLVISKYDHALLLSTQVPKDHIDQLNKDFEKVIVVNYQPTCENLLIEIKNELINAFKLYNVSLIHLKLNETPTSYAEWLLSDN